jgi:hypothetical protein
VDWAISMAFIGMRKMRNEKYEELQKPIRVCTTSKGAVFEIV